MSVPFVIGWSDNLGFGFTTLKTALGVAVVVAVVVVLNVFMSCTTYVLDEFPFFPGRA